MGGRILRAARGCLPCSGRCYALHSMVDDGRCVTRKARTIKAEVFRGPFDPGGQPEVATGQPLELSFFAWNVRGGLSATKAVMSDPARYRDYWHWPAASQLLRQADRIGFDHQVQYGMWGGWSATTGWNEEGLDFATAGAASAVVTERMNLFATVHVEYRFHPMHIAKIGACIDFISGGRWGLNVVTGVIPADFRKFGIEERPPGPVRYETTTRSTRHPKKL